MTIEEGALTTPGCDAPREAARFEAFDMRRFLVLVALAGVGLGMTAPLTVLYATNLGASDAIAGLAVSSIAISLLLVDIFGTQLVPRVDGRFSVWFSLVVFGFAAWRLRQKVA